MKKEDCLKIVDYYYGIANYVLMDLDNINSNDYYLNDQDDYEFERFEKDGLEERFEKICKENNVKLEYDENMINNVDYYLGILSEPSDIQVKWMKDKYNIDLDREEIDIDGILINETLLHNDGCINLNILINLRDIFGNDENVMDRGKRYILERINEEDNEIFCEIFKVVDDIDEEDIFIEENIEKMIKGNNLPDVDDLIKIKETIKGYIKIFKEND